MYRIKKAAHNTIVQRITENQEIKDALGDIYI